MQALSLDLIDAALYKVQLPGTGAGPAFENYRLIAYSCPIDDWRRRVENFLRTRIRTRLDVLGLNPFEAASRSCDLGYLRKEEITVRRINGAWLECNDAGSVISRIAVEGAEIIARYLST